MNIISQNPFTMKQRYALAILFGALVPLAFAPFAWWPVAIISLLALFGCWQGVTPRQAFKLGWLWGFASFATGTHWLWISLHHYGGLHPALALLLMLGMMAIMGLYPAVCGWLANRYWPNASAVRWLWALPVLWVVTEWLRGWVLTGFPWLSLGVSQVDGPLSAWLPILGQYGVSLLLAFIAGAIGYASFASCWRRLSVLMVVLVGLLASLGLQHTTWTQPIEAPLKVALVQGGVDQADKWLPENLLATQQQYYATAADHVDHDLIIWPESAIPALRHQLLPMYDALRTLLAPTNARLMLGTIEYDFEQQQFYNGLMLLGTENEPDQFYHKRHLVPFGEYFPVPAFVRKWLQLSGLPYQDYQAGKKTQPLLSMNDIEFAALVCFEAAFGREALSAYPGAGMIVNISNDGWFGRSIALDQHLQMTRVRAAEVQRPLLRSTNTGITASIDYFGQAQSQVPTHSQQVLSVQVAPRRGLTPYARWGEWPIFMLGLWMLCLLSRHFFSRSAC